MAWFIAVSRDRGPENGLHEKCPENRMVCGVGLTSPVTTVVFFQPVVMIFVKAPMIW